MDWIKVIKFDGEFKRKMDDKDMMGRRINDFAMRSFRDVADYDYIAARMAYRARLLPQFMWSAQQTIEKYLKCILLINRIQATEVRHDILEALKLAQDLNLDIREGGMSLIKHVAMYGEDRYLTQSSFIDGHALPKFDMAVWDLRRYCQVLNVFGKNLPVAEQKLLEKALIELKESKNKSPHTFRLNSGQLEKIINNKEHPARRSLVWQNAFFGDKARRTIKSIPHFQATNSPLWLYPQMLDELLKYIYVPDQKKWREYLNSK